MIQAACKPESVRRLEEQRERMRTAIHDEIKMFGHEVWAASLSSAAMGTIERHNGPFGRIMAALTYMAALEIAIELSEEN